MTDAPANPHRIGGGPVVIVVVLMLAPGGFFAAKGAVEVADRFAQRTTHEATVTTLQLGETIIRGRSYPRYDVSGVLADGEGFGFDDRRVYEMADGRTPLPVRVHASGITGRVLAVESDGEVIDGVGGAGKLWLAALGLGLGLALMTVPFLLPFQTDARKAAKKDGAPVPPPDWAALAMVTLAAVLVVGGTLAWDLLR